MSKITAYAALTAPQAADVVPVVDVSDTSMASSGTTKKITVANLIAAGVDWINVVSQYGADPAGAADSTAAIQAAINAGAVSVGATAVYIPAGKYKISSPLTLANGTIIIGDSGGGFGGAFPPGVSEILLAASSNCSMIVAPSTANHWRLSNLLLSGNGVSQAGPAQTGSTGAAIHVADAGSPAECQGELSGVFVEDSYNDALYLGNNRRNVRVRWCKFNDAGLNGSVVYGAGNGVTCAYSDHIFEACAVGNARHHGFYLVPNQASSIRITNCDLFTNGQDWASAGPTTVAAGSNGQAVSGLTGVGVLNVASTSGFPSAGSLFLNVPTGPVAVSYTGVSGGNQFTGVTVSATQGNQGGTLATGQGVYLLGGDAVHIGSGVTGVYLAGNSLDRNQGCGVFAETSLQSVNITGNRFSSNSAVADGLLPHVMIISPGLRVSLAANGMEPLASGFTNRCPYFVQGNGSGSWFDIANSWVSSALSTGKYTNNAPGINPFSNGSFFMQSANTGTVTAVLKLLGSQTADLLDIQNSSGTLIAKIDNTGTYNLANAGGFTPLTGSGQFLATTQYAPGTQAVLTTTSTTMAAVSSANVNTGAFTAPASGSVLVTANFVGSVSSAGSGIAFGLCAHGTITPMVGDVWQFQYAATGHYTTNPQWLITGLTAGTSYNFDLMFSVAGASTLSVYAVGLTATTPGFGSSQYGSPVLMTVQAV